MQRKCSTARPSLLVTPDPLVRTLHLLPVVGPADPSEDPLLAIPIWPPVPVGVPDSVMDIVVLFVMLTEETDTAFPSPLSCQLNP